MKDSHRYCVIMCGGIGSRFWPASRTDHPKQFLDFFGTGRSLLQMCYDRILPLVDADHILVVTNMAYRDLVLKQLPGINPDMVLCEPARRNTAPAIAWAAYHINALDPEASMMITPSDHFITRESAFVDCMARGFEFVESHDALLTLGIKPTRPETGYGYIQVGKASDTGGISHVKTFTEKPDLELAKVFVKSGEFFWNSGIFLWRSKAIIDAIHAVDPDLAAVFDEGLGEYATPGEAAMIEEAFTGCPAISIDYAVMEKANNVFVEMADFGWSDLGTWGSLYDQSPKTHARNVQQNCKVMAYKAEGNIISVEHRGKLVVLRGLKDYIIADTEDVLLIYPRNAEQELRQVVNDVKQAYGNKHT